MQTDIAYPLPQFSEVPIAPQPTFVGETETASRPEACAIAVNAARVETTGSHHVVTIIALGLLIACLACIVLGGIFKEWITITVGIVFGIMATFIILHKRMMYVWINVNAEVVEFWKIEMWLQAVVLYAVQTVLMDIFMHRSKVFYWPWIVFDVAVLIAVAALGHGYHHRPTATALFSSGQIMCLLSLAAYISLILGKTCVLLTRIPLTDAGFWSYSTFILLLGISIPIYFILRWSQGRAMIPEDERSVVGEPSREWKSYAEYLRLAINIADSVAILSLVSPLQRARSYDAAVLVVTLIFMCIAHCATVLSFFGPAMFYYLTYEGGRITPFGSLLHHEPFVLVDGLLFSLRIVTWSYLKYELSCFIVKNVFFFFMATKASKSLHYHLQTYKRANGQSYALDAEIQYSPRDNAHSLPPAVGTNTV